MQLIELLAYLSKLELTPKEQKRFAGQISSIIEYISNVKSLKTENIEPTFHTNKNQVELRKDQDFDTRKLKNSTKNALRTQDNYFVVDAVL